MGLPVLIAAGIATSLAGTATTIVQGRAAATQRKKQQRRADLAEREAKMKERSQLEDRNRAIQRQGAGRGKSTILGGEGQTEIGRNVLLGQ